MPEITIKEYAAQEGSRFTHRDAKIIGPVLHELSQQGGITSRDVVDTARSENSPLHPYFEWDNQVAADLYRLEEARRMMRSIKVRYIGNGEQREARAFQIAHQQPYETEPRRYRSFEVLHGDTAFAVQMMDSAFDDLLTWKRKYEPYTAMWERFGDCFQVMVNQIDEFSADHKRGDSAQEMDAGLVKLLAWRDEFIAAFKLWSEFHENVNFIFEAISDTEQLFKEYGERLERDCLKCGRRFKSSHSGNRVCPKCFSTFDKNTGGMEAITQRAKYEDE